MRGGGVVGCWCGGMLVQWCAGRRVQGQQHGGINNCAPSDLALAADLVVMRAKPHCDKTPASSPHCCDTMQVLRPGRIAAPFQCRHVAFWRLGEKYGSCFANYIILKAEERLVTTFCYHQCAPKTWFCTRRGVAEREDANMPENRNRCILERLTDAGAWVLTPPCVHKLAEGGLCYRRPCYP